MRKKSAVAASVFNRQACRCALFGLTAWVVGGFAGGPAAAAAIAISNVRIIDGNGGAPVEHGTLRDRG